MRFKPFAGPAGAGRLSLQDDNPGWIFNCSAYHCSILINVFRQNIIKDPQWYDVQEGDATMFHIASLPGQQTCVR